MPTRHRPLSGSPPGLSLPGFSFVVLAALLVILWLAGGATRANVPGQVIVRSGAWAALVAAALFGARPSWRGAGGLWLLMAAILTLPLIQLLPLPPGIWLELPGRAILAEAAAASGQTQPWRSWSIVPGATVNAASSLVVPVAVLVLLAGSGEKDRGRLPGLMLGLVAASMLVGLLQFSGAGFGNPLVNDTPGEVSGMFANRNHFALFMALGCLLAPVWAFLDGRRPGWQGPVALGLVLLFALSILASGSRAGLLFGGVGLGIGLILIRQDIRKMLRGYPRWVFPAAIAGIVGVIAIFVLVSVAADRASSIDRVFATDQGHDMRSRGLPTVFAMIQAYFPAGSGFGGFDTIFRMHEPFALLKPTYFNHAHNDFLEIVLDAGLPGLILLLWALSWYALTSISAWRAGPESRYALPKLGSSMILLVLIASGFDYPARTPMMMAFIMLAAMWLNDAPRRAGNQALPLQGQHL